MLRRKGLPEAAETAEFRMQQASLKILHLE
jgi:hypothetical protein